MNDDPIDQEVSREMSLTTAYWRRNGVQPRIALIALGIKLSDILPFANWPQAEEVMDRQYRELNWLAA